MGFGLHIFMVYERNRAISTQVTTSTWSASQGTGLVSPQVMNWVVRRRIALSLIGFTALSLYNVFVAKTVPLNPVEVTNPWVLLSLGVLGFGLAIRTWSAGTLCKMRELTQHGPYALVRNPLYVGSFLMMLGFCSLCRDLPTALFIAGPILFVYWTQVRFEEIKLSEIFAEEWPAYQSSVPRFVPRRLSSKMFRGWSASEWLKNREYQAVFASVFGVCAVVAWHWFRTQM